MISHGTGRSGNKFMKKRIFSLRAAAGLLAAAAAVLSLSACGDKADDNKETTAPATVLISQATTTATSPIGTKAAGTEAEGDTQNVNDKASVEGDKAEQSESQSHQNSSDSSAVTDNSFGGSAESAASQNGADGSSSSGTDGKSDSDSGSSSKSKSSKPQRTTEKPVIEISLDENELPFIPN